MINIYDIVEKALHEPDSITIQIYARALLKYRNPNRYFYDLDIMNDSLYKLRTLVLNIVQEEKLVEVVLLGCTFTYTHFCDVFVSIDNKVIDYMSSDGCTTFENVDNFIKKHINYNMPYTLK